MSTNLIEIYRCNKLLVCLNAPAMVEAYYLMKDGNTNKYYLQIIFRNISLKRYLYFSFDVYIYNNENILEQKIENIIYKDTIIDVNASFGIKKLIEVDIKEFSYIKILIKEVHFIDGSNLINNELCVEMPAERRAVNELTDPKLLEYYTIHLDKKAIDIFTDYHGVYRCCCSSINSSENEICRTCHKEAFQQREVNKKCKLVSDDIISSTSIETKDTNTENNQTKTHKTEANKKSIKTLIISFSIVFSFLLIAVVTITVKPELITYVKYSCENDPYTKYHALASIDIFDSKDQAKEICYQYVNDLYNDGNFNRTISVLTTDYEILGYDSLDLIDDTDMRGILIQSFYYIANNSDNLYMLELAYQNISNYTEEYTDELAQQIITYLLNNPEYINLSDYTFFIDLYNSRSKIQDKIYNIQLVHLYLEKQYNIDKKALTYSPDLVLFGYFDINAYYIDLCNYFDAEYYLHPMYKKIKVKF